MPTKCCSVIHGRLTSERKASPSRSSFINLTRPMLLERSSAKLLVFTCTCTRALDRLSCRTRRRVGGSTRRRGNHMHDRYHSRFQCDIKWRHRRLSLSLYYSQKSLTHNIGSASALPIIKMQRERKETFRRQRHHQSDRSWAVCVHLVVGHGTCVWCEVHFEDGCG